MSESNMTHDELVARGFVPRSGMTSLYVHERYPGFTFKRVDTLAQALACGALLLSDGDTNVFYFGNTMDKAAFLGKLGSVGRHFAFKRGVDETVRWQYHPSAAVLAGSRIYSADADWTNIVAGGKYVGVLSKADEGLIVDHVTNARNRQYTMAVDNSAWTSQGFAIAPGEDSITLAEPVVSGFIHHNIPVDGRKFLSSAKQGFLKWMGDSADAKIVAAYDYAFDDLINDEGRPQMVFDNFALYPVLVGVHIQWTHSRRIMRRAPGLAVGGRNVAPEGPNVNPDRSHLGTTFGVSTEQVYKGLPMAGVVLHAWGDYANYFNDGGRVNSSFAENVKQPATLSGADPYLLDKVPYASAKLYQEYAIPASALWASISPSVMPATEPKAVLDLTDRVNGELAAYTSGPALATISGATVPEREASLVAAETALDLRWEAFQFAKPHLTPFTRFVADNVVEIDKRAKAKLKSG